MKTTLFEEFARESRMLRERIARLSALVSDLDRDLVAVRAERDALWAVIDADRRLLAIVGERRSRVAAQPRGATEPNEV